MRSERNTVIFALKPREIRDFTTNTKSLIINALKEAAIKAMNS